ncbi:phage tail protein [Pseudomonas qingdaonensis]|uniref:phage tail protein n=1 Tax=Pseudomonas TaxID=286 RepID=UPI0018C950F6|nr:MULTISPECIES: phage tail protein [Pseudomonas]MBG8558640.1 phage tail protein [Pseudomonas qingdaonensis]
MVDQNSQFYAILTKVGAAKQANADALGIPWKITHMAVGDASPAGLDNPPLPMPDASWTSLLNEWRRAPLNQLKVDEKDSAVIVAEQVIPAEIGGRWIREVGLYDADGDLVAVANCAPTYKPLLNQGSGRTQVVRMNLVVSSASNVVLKIDPSVVLATREWVTEELARQDFKHSVLAATTAAITLSGLQTVDGVALTAGARVLVKNQAVAKDNGLYLVVAGGAWTRCTDADASAKVTPGMLVLVERGTVNADSAWQLLTDAPITLGVTALNYGMAFGRTGVAAGTYRSVQVDAYGRVVAATNPTTVAGYGLTDVYTKTQVNDLVQSLTIRATQPEAEAGTDDTNVMTPLRVFQAIAKVVTQATESKFGWAKVATQAQVTTGADDTTIITPKKLRAAQATQAEAEAGTDNAKIMPPLRVAQLALKMLNSWGVGTDNPPVLATFSGNSKTGFYVGAGAAAPNATPGCPPESANNLLGIVAVNVRSDSTYYFAFENGPTVASRRYWVGQWNDRIGTVFWSSLMTFDRIATQAQVDAGVADDVIVTPKKLRWGVSFSATPNGWLALPSWLGGFVFQWGADLGNAGASKTLVFPMAFPTQLFSITGAISGTSAAGISVLFNPDNLSKNSITFRCNNSSNVTVANAVFWFAVGK